MDYVEAVEVFFQPRSPDDPPPGTHRLTSPARLLRDALEPLATIGSWARPAYDRLADEGLDFLTGFVWGRAAALGEPPAAVVAAALAVYEPGLVARAYDEGRAACPRDAVLRAREEGATQGLADALDGEPAELGDVVAALEAGAAAADPAGRPLAAGLAALPLPGSPLGRLWRAGEVLREHRAAGHVAACLATGLDAVQMNLLTELWVGWDAPEYSRTRGWGHVATGGGLERLAARGLVTDGEGPVLTTAGRELRERIEDATDAADASVVGAVPDLPRVTALLAEWSDAVVEHGSYPPDPYKRAAG